VIDRETRVLRPPTRQEPVLAPAPAAESPDESLLEPGVLGERFRHARTAEQRRRPRWLTDILHVRHHEPSPRRLEPTREVELARRQAELDTRARDLESRELELRSLARRDETLREREQWVAELREELERRLTELDSLAERLELREAEVIQRESEILQRESEVLNREEAAGRWFNELTRARQQFDEERTQLIRAAAEPGR